MEYDQSEWNGKWVTVKEAQDNGRSSKPQKFVAGLDPYMASRSHALPRCWHSTMFDVNLAQVVLVVGGKVAGCTEVFVGNLSWDVDEDMLWEVSVSVRVGQGHVGTAQPLY